MTTTIKIRQAGDGSSIQFHAHSGNYFEVSEEKAGVEMVLDRQKTSLCFGDVIAGLRKDRCYARAGWNGKGIYIRLQNPDENSKMTQPCIYIVTGGLESDNPDAPRGTVPWLASQTDMLANDWLEVNLPLGKGIG